MCKNFHNEMCIVFDSKSENEAFARVVITAFVAATDPTVEEMADIKTAVSEAVTNCVIHGYEGGEGKITMRAWIDDQAVTIEIEDQGIGIENIEKAMTPLYTSKPELERSGMGFAFMEAFMDSLAVQSAPGEGTKIMMEKVIGRVQDIDDNDVVCKMQGA